MKQENVKIMKRLVILLFLSSLLIGLGYLSQILCCDLDSILSFLEDLVIGSFGHGFLLLVVFVIPLLLLAVIELLLIAAFFLAEAAVAVGTILSVVLAAKTGLQIRRGDLDNLSKGKRFLKTALILNAIAAVCLLLLDLFVFSLDSITVYPWGLISVLSCLTGGTLLVFGIFTYRKLEIPTAADSKGGTQI